MFCRYRTVCVCFFFFFFRNHSDNNADCERRNGIKKSRDKHRRRRRSKSKTSGESSASVPIPKITQVYRAEYDSGSTQGEIGSVLSEIQSPQSRFVAEGQFDDLASYGEASVPQTKESGERRKDDRKHKRLDLYWYSTDDSSTSVDDNFSIQESANESYEENLSKKVRFVNGSTSSSQSQNTISYDVTQSYGTSPSSSLKRQFESYSPKSQTNFPKIVFSSDEYQRETDSTSILVRGTNSVIEVRPKEENELQIQYLSNAQAATQPGYHETLANRYLAPIPRHSLEAPSYTPFIQEPLQVTQPGLTNQSPPFTLMQQSPIIQEPVKLVQQPIIDQPGSEVIQLPPPAIRKPLENVQPIMNQQQLMNYQPVSQVIPQPSPIIQQPFVTVKPMINQRTPINVIGENFSRDDEDAGVEAARKSSGVTVHNQSKTNRTVKTGYRSSPRPPPYASDYQPTGIQPDISINPMFTAVPQQVTPNQFTAGPHYDLVLKNPITTTEPPQQIFTPSNVSEMKNTLSSPNQLTSYAPTAYVPYSDRTAISPNLEGQSTFVPLVRPMGQIGTPAITQISNPTMSQYARSQLASRPIPQIAPPTTSNLLSPGMTQLARPVSQIGGQFPAINNFGRTQLYDMSYSSVPNSNFSSEKKVYLMQLTLNHTKIVNKS